MIEKNRKLSVLLEELEILNMTGDIEQEISEIQVDSRKVSSNCLFVCIKGANSDGHQFISQVIRDGCTALIVEDGVEVPQGITVIRVQNTREALAKVSAAYYGHPARKLQTIGITGTKGKTTTTYMIRSMLESVQLKTGLIGTIEVIIGDQHIPANNTTPESILVQQYFYEMVQAGCTHVVMEVSSQGLMLHRVSGFTFDYGIFTNLESDHIGPNEHKDFEDYLQCKSILFKHCKCGIANFDDEHTKRILEGNHCETIIQYGFQNGADILAGNISLERQNGEIGISFPVSGLVNDTFVVNAPGRFSAYNAMAALTVAYHLGVDHEQIKRGLKSIHVKGRVEPVSVSDDFTMLIDYAHNAMSLKSLLLTIKEYDPGRLVVLFGCGGNRSRDRRFEMGEISSNIADLTIVTSDNPRFEEPKAIIEDILTGVKKGTGEYVMIEDRKEAIKYAITHAKKGDIIILAGKGHETYQEIKGIKYDMDERVMIREIKEELA